MATQSALGLPPTEAIIDAAASLTAQEGQSPDAAGDNITDGIVQEQPMESDSENATNAGPIGEQGLFLSPADNATEQQTEDGDQGLLPPTDQGLLPPTDQGLLPPADNATGQQQDGGMGLGPQLPTPQATEDNVNDGSASGDLQSQQGEQSGSEICDDGTDNDGDGLIDISDQDCVTESEADGSEEDSGVLTEETEQQTEGEES